MKKEYKMSAARQQELQDELTYLKTVREKEVADLIKEARGFGDLSENSEYDEAKNEQGKLYSRIAEVEEILLHTVIVDENDAPSGHLQRPQPDRQAHHRRLPSAGGHDHPAGTGPVRRPERRPGAAGERRPLLYAAR